MGGKWSFKRRLTRIKRKVKRRMESRESLEAPRHIRSGGGVDELA